MNKGKRATERITENTRLTAIVRETLTSVCSIQRITRISNGAGGFSETWTVPVDLSDIPCALNTHNHEDETITVDRPGAVNSFVLHLPPNTDIRHSDRVLIGSSTYQVVSIPEPVSIEVARTVYVVWVE